MEDRKRRARLDTFNRPTAYRTGGSPKQPLRRQEFRKGELVVGLGDSEDDLHRRRMVRREEEVEEEEGEKAEN